MPGQIEPGGDKAAVRTVAVIVLMLLAAVALRGYLPGAQRRSEPDEVPAAGYGSFLAVVVILVVSIAAIAIALVAQARRRPTGPAPGEPRREIRAGGLKLRWRPLLISAAAIAVWSVLMILLLTWTTPPTLDGQVPPDSGATAERGAETAADPAPPQEPRTNGGNMFGVLAGATAVLLVLSIAATVVGRRRAAPPAAAVTEPTQHCETAEGPDLARAAALGLAAMDDLNREPREAIIACYLAMEQELEKSPGTVPQLSDTPTEVLARAIESHALRSGTAAGLVDLFEEARFSPHVMNEGHRADAVRALRLVQRELQAAT